MTSPPVSLPRDARPAHAAPFDATWAVLLLAVVVLAARFWRLDLAPFYKDDPRFLAAAAAQLTTGHWVTASPILGSSDLHYGPSIIWFYGALQAVVGFEPLRMVVAMCALISVVQLWFACAVAKAYTESEATTTTLAAHLRHNPRARLTAGCVLLLLASSPVQFIWSRMAWDQLTMVVGYAVIALLASARPLTSTRLVVISGLLGIGLSSHPMIVPLIVIVGGEMLLTPRQHRPSLARTVAALLLPGLIVNLPWFASVLDSTARSAAHGIRAPMVGAGAVARWLDIPMAIGAADLQYYFDTDWPALLGAVRLSPTLIGIAGLVLCLMAMAVGSWSGIQNAPASQRRLVRMAISASLLFAAFMTVIGAGLHPHYQFPTGWIPLTLLASAIATTRRRALLQALVTFVMVCSAGQSAITFDMMRWIDAQQGTRGFHYGMTLGAQRGVVRELCSAAPPRTIHNYTAVVDFSLRYLLMADPTCAGRAIAICPGATCREAMAGERTWLWMYTDTVGARATLRERVVPSEPPPGVTPAPPPQTPATSTR